MWLYGIYPSGNFLHFAIEAMAHRNRWWLPINSMVIVQFATMKPVEDLTMVNFAWDHPIGTPNLIGQTLVGSTIAKKILALNGGIAIYKI